MLGKGAHVRNPPVYIHNIGQEWIHFAPELACQRRKLATKVTDKVERHTVKPCHIAAQTPYFSHGPRETPAVAACRAPAATPRHISYATLPLYSQQSQGYSILSDFNILTQFSMTFVEMSIIIGKDR